MDKIKIHGLSFFAHHGVFEQEKIKGQEFIIDCEFEIDTSRCNDQLDKTVNYGEVSLDIVDFATKNQYDLLEALANKLARYLLGKFHLMAGLTLTIHKPNAPIPTKFDDVTLTIHRQWTTAFLATGSNLGDRQANLDSVLDQIAADPNMELAGKSSYLETPPYGVVDQPDFYNGVIKIQTIYTPYELLDFCHRVETLAGRVRKRRWGERTLDVDILTFGDVVIYNDNLKIPHPEMHLRDFVLKPLCEIEPYLIHPVLKKNVTALLKELSEN
ncbi:MAG: 2-amino-4-hydroxy-6-hydroxymethyldihydropteridine diphosphokinase [Erysipelotrichaceae bacterium]|nr:2-amino-4-hydroxy-6-hydroxymethyldihydropteridine diphosphokinase [Erysipelotrichaceae bacterium]